MNIKVFILCLLLAPSLKANSIHSGASLGINGKNAILSINGYYNWTFFADRLAFGLGGRHTSFFGSEYKALPVTGGDGQFMSIQDPQIHALNAAFFSSFRYDKFAAGFNIDLFGISYGPKKKATEFSNGLSGKPASTNILKGAAKDKGTLNSEFWLGYYLNPQCLLRLGLAHFVAEYKTDQADATGNNRFREFEDYHFLAFTYVF